MRTTPSPSASVSPRSHVPSPSLSVSVAVFTLTAPFHMPKVTFDKARMRFAFQPNGELRGVIIGAPTRAFEVMPYAVAQATTTQSGTSNFPSLPTWSQLGVSCLWRP